MTIVITGAIGVGKSSLVTAVLAEYGRPVYGVKTAPVDTDDRRQGFSLQALPDGPPQVMATPTGQEYPRFNIHLDVFNVTGVKALTPQQPGVGLIDELGLFEREAKPYVDAVAHFAKQPGPRLIVVQQRALDFWSSRLPASVNPIIVTKQNRNTLVHEILNKLTSKPSRPTKKTCIM